MILESLMVCLVQKMGVKLAVCEKMPNFAS